MKFLTQCTRCGSSMIQLDTQLAADAELHGVLNRVPLRYYCWGCSHSIYTFIPDPLPDDPIERLCENCKLPLEKGRRRFCSDRCARPTRAEQRQIDEERHRRERDQGVRDLLEEDTKSDV